MQIKTLEVKNISHYARGSEETPCYNATVYINGKRSIEVSNDGRGGMDMQHAYPSIEDRCLVQQANEWCVEKFGQHTWEHGGKTYSTDNDLEHVCHQALYDWLDSKELKKQLKTKYLCVDKDDTEDKEFLVAWKRKGNHTDDWFKNFLKDQQPHMVDKCLNFLPFNKALELFKEYA
jgi:hypothetical protein|tara:strand:- start:4 stop:531 length:528 start_codon:yes stop_codon:yes gene_type:complete